MVGVSGPMFPPTLADLSRSASTISSSSSIDDVPELRHRPRPIRTFSAPRSKSPGASATPRAPSYLSRELGLPGATERARSESRTRALAASAVTVQDFEFGEILGEGAYSEVKIATHLATGKQYAAKVIDKNHLIRHKKVATATAEKNALLKLRGHPGIIQLWWSLQDEYNLYFILDLLKNGQMQTRISKLGSLSTVCARDIKPENMLLDDNFRMKLTDFGTGKCLPDGVETSKTFVGSAQYVAPELLLENETSKCSDLWSLGCFIFQMIAGRFAFFGLSDYLIFEKIKKLDYTFPDGFDEDAKDLIQKLLVRVPSERLGASDMKAIRSHSFFQETQWDTLWTGPVPPMEAGLVKKVQTEPVGNANQWTDFGQNWDDAVGGGFNDDELEWVPKAGENIGPLTTLTGPSPNESALVEEDQDTIAGERLGVAIAEPRARKRFMRGSFGSGTSGSSERSSPTESLGAALSAMSLGSRGRDRVLTPVQGNLVSNELDWSKMLLPGETIIFNSPIQTRSLRRRASLLLLPGASSPAKQKVRRLILTTQRLVCLKQKQSHTVVGPGGGGIAVKFELRFKPAEKGKEKEKEARMIVTSVEAKGERDFVVYTPAKAHFFAASSPTLAGSWVQHLNEIIGDFKANKRT